MEMAQHPGIRLDQFCPSRAALGVRQLWGRTVDERRYSPWGPLVALLHSLGTSRQEPPASGAEDLLAIREDDRLAPTGGRLQQVAARLVYAMCMSRTNIDLDDEACRAVMERYQLPTKRDAVNFALRTLAAEPFSVDEARRLRGSGWEGDLDEMRAGRAG